MKRFTAFFFAIIILLAGCSNEPPVEVTVAKVQTVEGNVALTYDGKISLSDAEIIQSPVSGSVVAEYFSGGTDVKEGQPLFKVGKQQDEAELLQTKTALAEAMTALPKELAAKSPNVAKLQEQIAELQARIEQLEADSEVGIVRAPKSGRIGAESVKLGEGVLANDTILATIGEINPLSISFKISGAERQFLSASSNVKVRLKFIDGTPYPSDGTLKILDDSTAEATFDNSEGLLLLGMDVKIELDGVNVPKTLLIPESAVYRREGENFVFVVSADKTAVEKKISLGDKFSDRIIVTDGLKADDSVVVEGLTNLREGTPLAIKNDK